MEIALPALLSVAGGVAANKLLAPNTSGQEAEIAKQREAQGIALDKQRETLQAEEAEAAGAEGSARKLPRGRRLLLAATSDKLGG